MRKIKIPHVKAFEYEGITYDELDRKFPKGYQVTGVLHCSTTRFSDHYTRAPYAMGINLWRGSVWGIDAAGRRTLLKRVFN